jgi:hypothetical protein
MDATGDEAHQQPVSARIDRRLQCRIKRGNDRNGKKTPEKQYLPVGIIIGLKIKILPEYTEIYRNY